MRERRSRRTFLKRVLAAIPLGAVGRLTRAKEAVEPGRTLGGSTLQALGSVVLPSKELGPQATLETMSRFESWCSGFEPVAELDHPYLWSDEIRYGPADPRPQWAAQLEALQLEASRRHQADYASLDRGRQEEILLRQLPEELPEALPHPSEAAHVAIALAAWYFTSAGANDLCYQAAIGRHECRGLPTVADRPRSLESSDR